MARLRKKRKKRSKEIIKTSVLKIVVLLLIICLNWAGLSDVLETFAFFSDNEDSNANIYQAGTLDFSLNAPGDFSPDLEPSQTISNRTINVSKDGSLGFQYRVRVESATGGLCSYLELMDDLPGSSFQWLSSFVSGNTTFSNKSSWTFTVRSSSFGPSLQGTICNFKLVFEGWQENIANYGDGGFSDTEEVENTIKMGYWNPPVVLNEFLPNARNYPEFIELYNKTALSIDLSGFYIMAGNNRIDINYANTLTYSSGLTTIAPSGWLVITAGGDLLDDTSGTVALYNPNDVEVDSYTYDASDYNINNTPGWTNNLVGYWPFDNDTQDKSGNENNGIMYGASLVSGKINQALSFDGVNDYVTIANSDDFNFGSGEFSAEFWTKTDSNSRQWVGTRYENYGPGWGLGTQNSHTLGYIRTSESGTNKKEIEGNVDVADNAWHHLIMVRIGDEIKIYTDGSFEKEGTLAGDVNNNKPIEIGRISWSGGSQYFKGLIDEIKIYDRALDATEISAHYNDVGVSSGLVPEDKSYARIPDGIGSWVDPFPTPGGPNILESEIINQEPDVEEAPIQEPISDEIFNEEPPIEEESVGEETPTILEEPITEEESVLEEEIVEELVEELVEEPAAEEEPTIKEAPIIEEEPIQEEVPVPEDEITTEEIIETSGEITEDVIEDVVEEVVEATVTEETPADEAPAAEEQPAVLPDDDFSTQTTTGESEGDVGSGDGDDDTSLDSDSPTESVVESSSD